MKTKINDLAKPYPVELTYQLVRTSDCPKGLTFYYMIIKCKYLKKEMEFRIDTTGNVFELYNEFGYAMTLEEAKNTDSIEKLLNDILRYKCGELEIPKGDIHLRCSIIIR